MEGSLTHAENQCATRLFGGGSSVPDYLRSGGRRAAAVGDPTLEEGNLRARPVEKYVGEQAVDPRCRRRQRNGLLDAHVHAELLDHQNVEERGIVPPEQEPHRTGKNPEGERRPTPLHVFPHGIPRREL